jgi:hypothetical protein
MWKKDESIANTNKMKNKHKCIIGILLWLAGNYSLVKLSDRLSGKGFVYYMDPYQFSIFIYSALGPDSYWKEKLVSGIEISTSEKEIK